MDVCSGSWTGGLVGGNFGSNPRFEVVLVNLLMDMGY